MTTPSTASTPPPVPGAHHDPAVRVAKLGYVGLQTPDVARLIEYYTTVLDFEVVESSPSQVFLTTGFDHHCVVVDKAETAAGRTFIGYEVHGSLDDAGKRLTDRGYPVERRSDIGPGTPDVVVVVEPSTGVPLHLYESQVTSGVSTSSGARPSKLGHVAAFTPGLADMQGFYQELLGFRWSDTIGDFFVFLRCNVDHHAANFMASSRFQGMHHVAYEMRNLDHLQTMLDRLAAHDIRLHWGPGRHGAGHNIFTYHDDPDGNQVELFTQLDAIYDEEKGYFEPRPWHESFPQYPKTWEVDVAAANKWGPIHRPALDH